MYARGPGAPRGWNGAPQHGTPHHSPRVHDRSAATTCNVLLQRQAKAAVAMLIVLALCFVAIYAMMLKPAAAGAADVPQLRATTPAPSPDLPATPTTSLPPTPAPTPSPTPSPTPTPTPSSPSLSPSPSPPALNQTLLTPRVPAVVPPASATVAPPTSNSSDSTPGPLPILISPPTPVAVPATPATPPPGAAAAAEPAQLGAITATTSTTPAPLAPASQQLLDMKIDHAILTLVEQVPESSRQRMPRRLFRLLLAESGIKPAFPGRRRFSAQQVAELAALIVSIQKDWAASKEESAEMQTAWAAVVLDKLPQSPVGFTSQQARGLLSIAAWLCGVDGSLAPNNGGLLSIPRKPGSLLSEPATLEGVLAQWFTRGRRYTAAEATEVMDTVGVELVDGADGYTLAAVVNVLMELFRDNGGKTITKSVYKVTMSKHLRSLPPGSATKPPGGYTADDLALLLSAGAKMSRKISAEAPSIRVAAEPDELAGVGEGRVPVFVEVLKELLPFQSGKLNGWTAAYFGDFNGDGWLDYWNLHHVSVHEKQEIFWAWENPSSPSSVRSMYKWVMAMAVPDPDSAAGVRYMELFRGPSMFHLNDTMDEVALVNNLQLLDSHGWGFIDIDRDGRKDFFTSVEASQGFRLGPITQNFLMWGEGPAPPTPYYNNATPGDALLHFPLVGGHGAAVEAGLDDELGFARHILWLDADGDGLLDVYICNLPRADGILKPSRLFLSATATSPRHRQAAIPGVMEEFCLTAMLTDLDGDGFAREVVMARTSDFSNGKFPHVVPSGNYPDASAADEERKAAFAAFYEEHTVGDFATYALQPYGQEPVQVFPAAGPDAAIKVGFSRHELLTGDLDGDGVIDLVEVSAQAIRVFLSTGREPGSIPSDYDYVVVDAWMQRQGSSAVSGSLVDLDLDGVLEIFVVTKHPGSNRIYIRTSEEPLTYTRTSAVSVGLDGASGPHVALKPGKPHQSAGHTVADFNNDGFPDIYISYDGQDKMLLNVLPQQFAEANRTLPNYVAFVLQGVECNVDGVGASVTVHAMTAATQDGGGVGNLTKTVHVREVRRSPRQRGFDDEREVFGLGVGGSVLSVTVRWPNGRVQEVSSQALLPLNNIQRPHVIVEDTALAKEAGW